jgi:hypothetical protein
MSRAQLFDYFVLGVADDAAMNGVHYCGFSNTLGTSTNIVQHYPKVQLKLPAISPNQLIPYCLCIADNQTIKLLGMCRYKRRRRTSRRPR